MGETLTEFVKNCSLVTVLNFLFVAMLILIGVAFFLFARKRRCISWFFVIGILPAVSGILTMYFQNKAMNRGVGMFGRLRPWEIASGRREAVIDLSAGVAGTIVVLLLRFWRQRLIAKRNG